jgi:histidyl-tRNA synthetase
MAVQKPTIPKGTRDFGPAEVQKRKYILNTIETVFKKYGFMPIETPTMENLSTLEGKYGDEGDKLLFRVLNSGETLEQIRNPKFEIRNQSDFNKTVTEKGLRYDLTVPFARYVVMNKNEITFPFKRYQMQPVWRADRPQKGRYREFWQCDADVVGSDSLLNEADLIQIYLEVFQNLGIKVEIKINNRKILDGLAHILSLSNKLIDMTNILDKEDKIGRNSVKAELIELGADQIALENFFTAVSHPLNMNIVKDFFKKNEISEKGIQELEFVAKALEPSFKQSPNLSKSVIHDLALARGLSYYTGCIFEVVSTEGSLKSSIGGGGRYDNLTGIFGLPNVSGVGISFGLDRIYDVIEELKLFPEGLNATSTQVLICTFDETTQTSALSILKKLRDTQIASELYPELPQSKKEKENPMQKPMNYADALKIPFRLIIKEDSMMLKDISGNVIPVTAIEEIISKLKDYKV